MGGGEGALDGLDSAGAPSTLGASPAAESPRRVRRPREESTEERLARADAIVAELNWEPETDDPEGLAGLVDAAPAVSSRGHG